MIQYQSNTSQKFKWLEVHIKIANFSNPDGDQLKVLPGILKLNGFCRAMVKKINKIVWLIAFYEMNICIINCSDK